MFEPGYANKMCLEERPYEVHLLLSSHAITKLFINFMDEFINKAAWLLHSAKQDTKSETHEEIRNARKPLSVRQNMFQKPTFTKRGVSNT